MASYTIRLFGEGGELHSEMILEHDSDDDVIDAVGNPNHPQVMEIWDGERHVTTFPAVLP